MKPVVHLKVYLILAAALFCGLQTVSGEANDLYADRYFDPRISAQSVGAGALGGSRMGAEALFGNPANLGSLRYSELVLGGGVLTEQGYTASAAFGQPLPGAGKIGVSLSHAEASEADSNLIDAEVRLSTEQSLALAYVYEIVSGFNLGLRFRALQVQTQDRRRTGEGLDLGLNYLWSAGWAACSVHNLLQPQITASEGPEYPRRLQADAGLHWPEVLQIAMEYARELDSPHFERLGIGIESAFSSNWFLRAGADQHAYYVGAGFAISMWRLDYGTRIDSGTYQLQHFLGLQYKFGAYQAVISTPYQYLTKGGVNPRADIKIQYTRDVVFKAWSLEIRDGTGELIKSLNGNNALPEKLRWEGRNQQGRMVSDGPYTMTLTGEDYAGNKLCSNAITIKVISPQMPEFQQVK